MTKEIIKKYGINFQNKIDEDGTIEKIPMMNLDCILLLLVEWNAPDIDDGLLVDIDEALVNPNSEIEGGSSFVDILIYQDITKFYPGSMGEIYSIPTIDFREIVVGWRDFLLTPPLNGTKV
ncbi:hypothetical protein [Pedobacter frigiditerrae]|uniref:hypothetical protein n=1 Tax=Pedobacter frigiditerrae TaxID=2530452 RepID=UPI00292D6BBA|nr:hypothetical protein [Pedobacter frigiditerrae]